MCVCVGGRRVRVRVRGGGVFGNTFSIIGFDRIKCGWVVEQDSH